MKNIIYKGWIKMFKIFRGFLCNKYRDKGMFYKNNREIINEIN